jgi:LacI family transcriptional regulator
MRDIASAAGISKTAVSYALQNNPKIGEATRIRVWDIAKSLGYSPDPRIASWMARVRDAASKRLATLAWMNCHWDADAWQKYEFLAPYLAGARARAAELGYQIDQLWIHQPGMTMKRMSRIIYQRGIDGVIFSPFSRHFRLRWEHLASITIEWHLLVPRLNRISTDIVYNFLLALKKIQRSGYRRIGICIDQAVDSQNNRAISTTAWFLNASSKRSIVVPPLFYAWGQEHREIESRKEIARWIRRYKPEVILCLHGDMVNMVQLAGFRVPEEIGVVHLAIDDDVKDWTGIYSNRRAIGAAAVEMIVGSIVNRQFGIPEVPKNTLIQGTWHDGRTLLVPKKS